MTTRMAKINLIDLESKLSPADFSLVKGIVNTRTGMIRASKPEIEFQIVQRKDGKFRVNNMDQAKTAYIWRMVVFAVSSVRAHQCMPCTADFDIPERDYDKRRAIVKHLDDVADVVVHSIPVSEWAGVKRWGNVFGVIGQPQVTEEGAIIYR